MVLSTADSNWTAGTSAAGGILWGSVERGSGECCVCWSSELLQRDPHAEVDSVHRGSVVLRQPKQLLLGISNLPKHALNK